MCSRMVLLDEKSPLCLYFSLPYWFAQQSHEKIICCHRLFHVVKTSFAWLGLFCLSICIVLTPLGIAYIVATFLLIEFYTVTDCSSKKSEASERNAVCFLPQRVRSCGLRIQLESIHKCIFRVAKSCAKIQQAFGWIVLCYFSAVILLSMLFLGLIPRSGAGEVDDEK